MTPVVDNNIQNIQMNYEFNPPTLSKRATLLKSLLVLDRDVTETPRKEIISAPLNAVATPRA